MVILYTISRDGIRDREENTMAKYCTQCGRKLEDGEVCTCTSQNNNAAGASQTSPGGQQQYQQTQQQYQQQAQQQYQQTQQQYQQTQQQGQTGGYTKEAEWINKQKDAFVSGTKSMFSEILPLLKSPVSRVRKISSSGNAATGIQLIIAKNCYLSRCCNHRAVCDRTSDQRGKLWIYRGRYALFPGHHTDTPPDCRH